MKVSSKPISSPGRTERFPTPLMLRFLRSNVGSRSRGRSRLSPMFVRKKNNAAVIESAQEPSSPKVTCMGQVRVRRSSKNPSSLPGKKKTPPNRRRRLWSFRKPVLGTHFGKFHRLRSFRPLWRRWVLLSRFVCCRKFELGLDSSTIESNHRSLQKGSNVEDDVIGGGRKGDDEGRGDGEVFPSSSPPKNALLLTRCRSAPYRSSSLASQLWNSPLPTTETEGSEDESKMALNLQQQGEKEIEEASSGSQPNCKDLPLEDKESEGNSLVSNEFEENSNGNRKVENKFEEMTAKGGSGGGGVYPLTLTRCKSEPARRGERLNPTEASFWRHRRLEHPDPCSQT